MQRFTVPDRGPLVNFTFWNDGIAMLIDRLQTNSAVSLLLSPIHQSPPMLLLEHQPPQTTPAQIHAASTAINSYDKSLPSMNFLMCFILGIQLVVNDARNLLKFFFEMFFWTVALSVLLHP